MYQKISRKKIQKNFHPSKTCTKPAPARHNRAKCQILYIKNILCLPSFMLYKVAVVTLVLFFGIGLGK